MPIVNPDARKSLPMLYESWAGCTSCSLGEHRNLTGGQLVHGEGRKRGVLLVGEGPGATEERQGRPFVGRSGKVLRRILERIGLQTFYITNLVLCRACAPREDSDGNPIMYRPYPGAPPQIRYQDQPPSKIQKEACAPRLYEEIYIVDPIVIVAMGQPAASFLRGGAIKIARDRGIQEEVSIPGAGTLPALTSKTKKWLRARGTDPLPVEQNRVRYTMIPTWHPAFVARRLTDERDDNPFQQLVQDILQAKRLFDRYYIELSGITPDAYEEEAELDMEALQEELLDGEG